MKDDDSFEKRYMDAANKAAAVAALIVVGVALPCFLVWYIVKVGI